MVRLSQLSKYLAEYLLEQCNNCPQRVCWM